MTSSGQVLQSTKLQFIHSTFIYAKSINTEFLCYVVCVFSP